MENTKAILDIAKDNHEGRLPPELPPQPLYLYLPPRDNHDTGLWVSKWKAGGKSYTVAA